TAGPPNPKKTSPTPNSVISTRASRTSFRDAQWRDPRIGTRAGTGAGSGTTTGTGSSTGTGTGTGGGGAVALALQLLMPSPLPLPLLFFDNF
ncbi:hypothetical protein, partial [Granulicella sp. L46]|uniref:hypothetical protein n=1 Tax=Granulicella sp. L46 TaxID=1641865 RepID=UPI001C20B08E